MRIALAFPGCHRRAGVERVMVECANYLAGRGHDVHVFASEFDEGVLSPAVRRHTVPLNVRIPYTRLLLFAPRVSREMARIGLKPDVTGTFGALSPPGSVIWAQSVHAAWLESSRSVRGLRGRAKQYANPMHLICLRLEQRCYGVRSYRQMIALSPRVSAELQKHYGVPEPDIEVLPNGFQPLEFSPEVRLEWRDATRADLGVAESEQIVVFVANEYERKGFLPLVRAMASLRDGSLRLVAVGRLDPAYHAAEIRRLGMTGRVLFVGPTGEVARYYAAGDVFALPTYYEAWGLVIVEALACGLPVLTSRLAGASVAVREGVTGELLDDPRDSAEIAAKLQLMLSKQPPSCREVAESVREYGWDAILQRYEQILEACAS